MREIRRDCEATIRRPCTRSTSCRRIDALAPVPNAVSSGRPCCGSMHVARITEDNVCRPVSSRATASILTLYLVHGSSGRHCCEPHCRASRPSCVCSFPGPRQGGSLLARNKLLVLGTGICDADVTECDCDGAQPSLRHCSASLNLGCRL